MTTHIEFENVSKTFDQASAAVLNDVSFEIKKGDFVALLGLSGSGKSTILRLIAGLEKPSSGQLRIHHEGKKFDRGYVFQESHLMPWRDILTNVELPLELTGIAKDDRKRQSLELLKQVGLEKASHLLPAALSGGMKMRASLARALVGQPSLLLLDEPFAALDETTRFKLAEDLRHQWQTRQMTVVFVTHSITEATFLANRALVLSSKPAQIAADLPIQLPPVRNVGLLTEPIFLNEMKKVSEAFHKANPRGDL